MLRRNLLLIPGWRTRRRIVVIESDDWGSVRMPNTETVKLLSERNAAITADKMSLDSLESNTDLEVLFEALQSVKDKHGNPAMITANTIVANPDFRKIKASGFREYHFEVFPDTLKKYAGSNSVMNLIRQGIEAKVYQPQYHGREHVNVCQWLRGLQQGYPELTDAFDFGVFGVPFNNTLSKRKNLTAALDYETQAECEVSCNIVKDGVRLFQTIFGFQSKTFIATSYVWSRAHESVLSECGIQGIQGIPFQLIPNPQAKWYKRKFHYTGQRNDYGQIYLVRNAAFEPTMLGTATAVEDCLQRIGMAFRWNKPAIIGSHRVNFIGSIREQNRKANIELLRELLQKITHKWPMVEFMSSDQLLNLINEKN